MPEEKPIRAAQQRSRREFDRLFDALADAGRLHVLKRLERFSATAGQIAPDLGWTRDEVAKQLKLLERAGLVEGARSGNRAFYALSSQGLAVALDWSSALWMQLPKAELQDAELLGVERQVELSGALRSLARRDILECICHGEAVTQAEVAASCRLSQGLTSRGLAHLINVGLVSVRTTDPPRRYAAVPATMASLVNWLLQLVLASEQAEADELRRREARANWNADRAPRG